MERSIHPTQAKPDVEFLSTYDLERQLDTAERRYGETRAAADKARAEWRDLLGREGSTEAALLAARGRFDALATRCARLRDHIDEIEKRLEG